MGILCWIADSGAWMRSVAATLAPGGKLILMDGHPDGAIEKPEVSGILPASRTPRRFIESGWDYATPTRTGPQIQFRYSLLDIVSAATDAGLRVLELLEHTSVSRDLCIKNLRREEDGRYRHRVDMQLRPVLFTLIAGR